jgi:hypothetical protein
VRQTPTLARLRPRLVVLGAAALALLGFVLLRGGGTPPVLLPGADRAGLTGDPLAWSPQRSQDDARRAAEGLAHVLYAKSPGGIVASARATASWRPLTDRVARRAREDPDTLEAIVLLESAGRAEARASNSLEGAVGLTQILAETGRDLLGMRVDVAASARLTRRIARAEARGRTRRAQRLRAARRRVDERFDPGRALAATARYLSIARRRLERDDLAVASYHMGIGNLREALSLYGAPAGVPYAQLYFDSTPGRHEASQRFLTRLGDDSSTYLWRVEAARHVMQTFRDDPSALAHEAQLQTARGSAELVLHPPDDTKIYGSVGGGDLVALPRAYLLAHGVAPAAGSQGLRREALATLAYLGGQVRHLSGARAPLRVVRTFVPATAGYDVQATGYAFDVARTYASHAQALAFQFMLDRLTALNLIAWERRADVIHVTVAHAARELEKPMGVHPT